MSRLAKFLGIRMLRPGLIPPRIWNDLLEQIKPLRIQEVIGGTVQVKATGTTIEINRQPAGVSTPQIIPFRLTAGPDPDSSSEPPGLIYRVSSQRSSITDGTNGDAFDFAPAGTAWADPAAKFDTNIEITATAYIVLRAEIDPLDLSAADWTLAAIPEIDVADAAEVTFDAIETDEQEYAQLLIGKVTIEDGAVTEVAQAVFTPQLLTHGFLNGVEVRAFAAHWIHRADL